MADFTFIVIPELRRGLESDYKELRACLDAQAWKAVHVLAGSIVEAVLIDALGHSGVDQNQLERKKLETLIDDAKQKNILDAETGDLSTVIRHYRNLIHPGRITRLAKTVDRSGAIVAAEVVEIVTRQVAKHKQETYGFTAEQLLTRLGGGSSALSLVAHLVRDTPLPELERLLIDLLPTAYFAAIEDPNAEPGYEEHLLVCYRSVFELASEEIKTNVCKHIYTIYRNDLETTVNAYEDKFFRASDLNYLVENERDFIKIHFLKRLDVRSIEAGIYHLEGIGPFLTTPAEARIVAVKLLSESEGEDALAVNVTQPAKTQRAIAHSVLLSEYPRMNDQCHSEVRDFAELINPDMLSKLERLEAQIRFAASGGTSNAVN
jgi:hypothetical protein